MQCPEPKIFGRLNAADAVAGLPVGRVEHWRVVLGMLGLMLALQWCGVSAYALLRYERALLLSEPWRVLTAHWVHLNAWHCALNAAGLAVWAAWVGQGRWRECAGIVFALCLAVGVLLPAFADIGNYAGLSGVLYGLFTYSCVRRMRQGQRGYALGVVIVAARVMFQLWLGPSQGEEELMGGTIVVSAHVIGAVSGVLFGTVTRLGK